MKDTSDLVVSPALTNVWMNEMDMPRGTGPPSCCRAGDAADEVVALGPAGLPVREQLLAVVVELPHLPLNPCRLLGIHVGVDRDGQHLGRGHVDEPLAHVARHTDELGHERGGDLADRPHEFDLGTRLNAGEELVGDLGDARLLGADQAGPQRLHHDVADLPVARRVRDHQALEVGIAHGELAVGDRPAGLGRVQIAMEDLLLRPLGQLVHDRRRIAGVADGEPVPAGEQLGVAGRRSAGARTSKAPRTPSGSRAARTSTRGLHGAAPRSTRR